ncbi:MAG: peptide-methionine (S)-S-oxide reductase [Acidimicrobiales bacterium]
MRDSRGAQGFDSRRPPNDPVVRLTRPGARNVFRKDSSASEVVSPDMALPGRSQSMPVAATHRVLGNPMVGPFPENLDTLVVGMGCFWGAERFFWQMPGVYTTAVGYAGGTTPNPTYNKDLHGPDGPHRSRPYCV